MKKVLLISPFFIPRRRVGALRAFRFAVHLKEFGYSPAVLAIEDRSEKITAAEKKLLAEIPVYSISPPFDHTSQKTNIEKKTPFPRKKKKYSLAGWVDTHTPLDTWLYLFLMRYHSIKKNVRRIQPDLIWATGDPWSALWLGGKLSAAFNKPFIADFRDPWIPGDVSLRNRSRFSQFFDQKAERSIVNRAARIVFTSKSAEACYQEFYGLHPEKTATIYNSYSSFFAEEASSKKAKLLAGSNKYKLLFFGRFRMLSPVEPLVKAIQAMGKNYGKKTINLLEIHSFGQPDAQQQQMIEDAGLSGKFIFHDVVPPEESRAVMQQADLLLLTTHRQRKFVVPAKLWSYLSVEKPVLSIAPNPEVGEILRQTGAGFHAHPDEIEKAADYLFRQISAFKRTGSVIKNKPASGPKAQYGSWETTRQLAKLFDDVLKDGK